MSCVCACVTFSFVLPFTCCSAVSGKLAELASQAGWTGSGKLDTSTPLDEPASAAIIATAKLVRTVVASGNMTNLSEEAEEGEEDEDESVPDGDDLVVSDSPKFIEDRAVCVPSADRNSEFTRVQSRLDAAASDDQAREQAKDKLKSKVCLPSVSCVCGLRRPLRLRARTYAQLAAIESKLQQLLQDNATCPEIERLGREEFCVDLVGKGKIEAKFQATAEELRAKLTQVSFPRLAASCYVMLYVPLCAGQR